MKNYQTEYLDLDSLRFPFKRYGKTDNILAKFINLCVKSKVIHDKTMGVKRRQYELETKIKTAMGAVKWINDEIKATQGEIQEHSKNISKIPEIVMNTEELSIITIRSSTRRKKALVEEFPDFMSPELYGETYSSREEEVTLKIEGYKDIGCCTQKFFCF